MKKIIFTLIISLCVILSLVSTIGAEEKKCDYTFQANEIYRMESNNNIVRFCRDPEGFWIAVVIETPEGMLAGYFRPEIKPIIILPDEDEERPVPEIEHNNSDITA